MIFSNTLGSYNPPFTCFGFSEYTRYQLDGLKVGVPTYLQICSIQKISKVKVGVPTYYYKTWIFKILKVWIPT